MGQLDFTIRHHLQATSENYEWTFWPFKQFACLATTTCLNSNRSSSQHSMFGPATRDQRMLYYHFVFWCVLTNIPASHNHKASNGAAVDEVTCAVGAADSVQSSLDCHQD